MCYWPSVHKPVLFWETAPVHRSHSVLKVCSLWRILETKHFWLCFLFVCVFVCLFLQSCLWPHPLCCLPRTLGSPQDPKISNTSLLSLWKPSKLTWKFNFLELLTSCSWISILVKKEKKKLNSNSNSVLSILCLLTKMLIHSKLKFPIKAIFIFSKTFLCSLFLLKVAVRSLSVTWCLVGQQLSPMCDSLSLSSLLWVVSHPA